MYTPLDVDLVVLGSIVMPCLQKLSGKVIDTGVSGRIWKSLRVWSVGRA